MILIAEVFYVLLLLTSFLLRALFDYQNYLRDEGAQMHNPLRPLPKEPLH